MTAVAHLNCRGCGTRLEREELAAGQCVHCQNRELETLEHEQLEELVAREQEQLWA